MPKFSANLTMLFTEQPFLDRFEAARAAGFEAVEYMFPYDFAPEAVASRLRQADLRQVLFNLPAGDWAGGERGIACIPGREAEFRDGVGKAAAYAAALECRQLNCLVGLTPAGVSPEVVEATLVDNLRHAAAVLADHDVALLIEAVNTRDVPGFHIHGSAQARSIAERVGHPNLFFQYDIYHMQVMEGDLARTIAANLDWIRHVQVADNPGRNEPGTGEINFDFLFRHLDGIGYAGWVGCEYKPRGATVDGLTWLPAPARSQTKDV